MMDVVEKNKSSNIFIFGLTGWTEPGVVGNRARRVDLLTVLSLRVGPIVLWMQPMCFKVLRTTVHTFRILKLFKIVSSFKWRYLLMWSQSFDDPDPGLKLCWDWGDWALRGPWCLRGSMNPEVWKYTRVLKSHFWDEIRSFLEMKTVTRITASLCFCWWSWPLLSVDSSSYFTTF